MMKAVEKANSVRLHLCPTSKFALDVSVAISRDAATIANLYAPVAV